MSLVDIAADMLIEAANKGRSIRKLQRGLEVTLYDYNGCSYLRLYRGHERKLPSQTEINICLKAFFGEEYELIQEGARDDRRGGIAYWIKVEK